MQGQWLVAEQTPERIARAGLILFSLALLLAGCVGEPRGRKPSADWSRSQLVGETVTGSLGMAVEGAGERVYLVWPTSIEEQIHLHYAQLDSLAAPVVNRVLKLPPGLPRAPRLLAAGDGQSHLVWAHRPGPEFIWDLWYARLDSVGEFAIEPVQLSTPGMNVGRFVVASNRQGGGVVVWDDRATALYARSFSQVGPVAGEPAQLTTNGRNPAAQFDPDGRLHLAWYDGQRFLYANFTSDLPGPTFGIPVAELTLGPSDNLAGPALTIAEETAVLVWTTYSQSGQRAGDARAEYVTFPVDQPTFQPSTSLWLSPEEEQSYQPYQGAYTLSQLAPPPPSASFSTDYVFQPSAANGRGLAAAVALAMRQEYRLETFVQVAVAIYELGQFQGYQMASKIEDVAQEPVLVADTAGHLHLAWRQGAGGGRVAYATTAPAARARLDRLSFDDVANALFTGGIEGLTGVLFFPLAMGWLLPGVVVLGLYKLRRDDEKVTDRLSIVLLIVAVAFYQVTKLAFLPRIFTYIPFSAWLDVPATWSLPLRVVVPALALLAGVGAAEVVRRRSPSTLLYYLTLCGVDALLTLAVYGVNFLGVF